MHIHAHMLSCTYRSKLNLSKHGVRAWHDEYRLTSQGVRVNLKVNATLELYKVHSHSVCALAT